jgi:hypothetical protein
MAKKKTPKPKDVPALDPLDLIRQIGDEAMAATLKEFAEGKPPAKKKAPKKNPRSGGPIIHDDEGLQDDQEQFEADNPPEKRAQALKNLIELFKEKQAAKDQPKKLK